MGQCVEKLPHKCGSRSALQVFERDDGTLDAFCFSCSTYERYPYGKETRIEDIPEHRRLTKSKEEIDAELEEIKNLPVADIPERKLRKEALGFYGVKVGFSEEDGYTPKFLYFPYTKGGKVVGYKVRLLDPKRMWSVGNLKDVELFGWEEAVATGAKRLIVTEGEADCIALRRILQLHTADKWKEYIPAVCSLPHGAGSAGKDLSRLASKIRRTFKEVSFCFDNDEAGQKAVEEACKVIPEATVVNLPSKDANAALLEGKSKAAHKAVSFNAQKPKNTRLVWGREVHEAAKKPAEWGVPWPWEKMTGLTRGIRTGETYYLGAAQKMG